MKTALGVVMVVVGLAVIGGAVAVIAMPATEEDPGSGVLVATGIGLAGGMMLCIVGAERLSDRGRVRLGLAVVVGVGTASKYAGDGNWFLP